jgi:tRNA pseudouridine55 synthase
MAYSYVRALARDLGDALGCGGHLLALRRTRSGPLDVEHALPLASAEALDASSLAARVLSPADAVPHLASVQVTEVGLRRARHGNVLGVEHVDRARDVLRATEHAAPVRILAADGRLIAIAEARGGALHPIVVLG